MMILQQTRGALSSGDQLALDLPFAVTKSLTARIGPTPDFTRASAATFIGSDGLVQYAAADQPRFHHDPTTLECLGLLIEESRSNRIIQSENLAAASWSKNGHSITVNSVASPDGNLTADTVNVTTAYAGYIGSQIISVAAGQSYTASFWHKRGTATDARYSVRNENNFSFIVPLTSYYSRTSSLWTRISFSFIVPAGCSLLSLRLNNDSASTGTMFLWGAQLEAGTDVTSYIPTTTAGVVRSADVCSISDLSFYNATEGSVVGQSAITTSSASTSPELIRFGSADDKIQIGNTNAASQAVSPVIASGGVTTYNSASGTATVGASRKIASAYKADDAISAFNGSLGAADTSVTLPSGITTCTLFANSTGTFASLKYYRRRLPNAKLQALTV